MQFFCKFFKILMAIVGICLAIGGVLLLVALVLSGLWTFVHPGVSILGFLSMVALGITIASER